MKKLLRVILITFVFGMALVWVACKTEKPAEDEPSKSSRFVTVEDCWIYKIYVDKETGVMYTVSTGGYNAGNFTLLVDKDGKPLIWKEGE